MSGTSTAVAAYVRNEAIQQRMEELLGSRTAQITTSLLTAVNTNESLAKCKPETVLNAALTAASMDLPINANLGFAYIIPYNNKKKTIDDNGRTVWIEVSEAQFQIGYKGFIQLAQRSGFYRTINATDVREGELKSIDRLTGEIEFEWIDNEDEREKLQVIGYVGYFELMNGFNKMLYMTVAKIEKHALKYSKSYAYDKSKGGNLSRWSLDFDGMARKTVLKLLISKYGPMSTQLQEAIQKDQAVIDDDSITYVDNDAKENDIKGRRIGQWIPSETNLMNDSQKMFIDNILQSKGLDSEGEMNNWLWDNYGVGYKDLTESQAHSVLEDLKAEYKEGQQQLVSEIEKKALVEDAA